jgi:hypothetical protein
LINNRSFFPAHQVQTARKKLLQEAGMTVETVDFIEILAAVEQVTDER